MATRLLQVVVPADRADELDKLLESRHPFGHWPAGADAHLRVVQLILPAEEAEPLMDSIQERFADLEDFHLLLLPVEASVPHAEEPDQAPETEEDKPEGATERVSREELYAEVTEGMNASRAYLALTFLSAVVAAFGLLQDDIAVVIGAMVIAPLLRPNVALALATTLGDFTLGRTALRIGAVGIGLALLVATVMGWLLPVNVDVPALAARTQLDPSDLGLALAAGAAGTLAFTSGYSAIVIGVMVAVALMPPLVTVGLMLGSGHWALAGGAALLTLANIVCVNLAGTGMFLLQGVRPLDWWEAEKAKRATWRMLVIWTTLLGLLAAILIVKAIWW
ncbi:MAG: TIGR00341 family protein [Gammaproteobacteria bacterium]|jgi:uncharacterized hydrophobic protein (TIGR00341 family)